MPAFAPGDSPLVPDVVFEVESVDVADAAVEVAVEAAVEVPVEVPVDVGDEDVEVEDSLA